ncbi:hypothetical protein LCGC14_2533830, partial [marine sediment metagenome]
PLKIDLFTPAPARVEMFRELVSDLQLISQLKGQFQWEKPAKVFLQDWVDSGMEPTITDPKFIHYNRRRPIQILKLAMIMSASQRLDLIIKLSDLELAKTVLLDAEASLGGVISSMGSNPYKYQIDLIYNYIRVGYRDGYADGVPEHRVRQRLAREMPLHFIGPTLENMIEMKMIVVAGGEAPSRKFQPGEKIIGVQV